MKLYVLAVVLAAGCYAPSVRDCTVTCEREGDCTGGQRCEEGWCTAGTRCDPPAVLDAAAATSDAGPDASELCALGCTRGSCVDGVCVVDCSAPGACSEADVHCEPNLPCRVICGDGSCARKVVCDHATSCEVVCAGADACADDIQCSTGRCGVTCSGERSCKKRIKCKEACACDATCSGALSCGETPECPGGDSCRLGLGCASVLPGCDRCD